MGKFDFLANSLNFLSGAGNFVIGAIFMVLNIIDVSLAPAMLSFYLMVFGVLQVASQFTTSGAPRYPAIRRRFGFLYNNVGFWAFLVFVASLGISFMRTDHDDNFSLSPKHFVPFIAGCFTMFVSILYLGKAVMCMDAGYEEV